MDISADRYSVFRDESSEWILYMNLSTHAPTQTPSLEPINRTRTAESQISSSLAQLLHYWSAPGTSRLQTFALLKRPLSYGCIWQPLPSNLCLLWKFWWLIPWKMKIFYSYVVPTYRVQQYYLSFHMWKVAHPQIGSITETGFQRTKIFELGNISLIISQL